MPPPSRPAAVAAASSSQDSGKQPQAAITPSDRSATPPPKATDTPDKAGDFTDFETSQVSLYYFSDVPRLMYALNDKFQTIGGTSGAKAQADAQRAALAQAELDLADAQATVNRYQKQVLDLQEQQRQTNEKFKGANSNPSKHASRLQAPSDKPTAGPNSQNAVQSQKDGEAPAKTATGSSSGGAPDPSLAAAANQAQTPKATDATKPGNPQSNADAAKADRGNAQGADNTQDTLSARLAAAQQALSDAQTSVSHLRGKMQLAAQAESDAFAFARDNSPFLFASADASNSDPAKRVIFYAFNDSKTIFMRGKPNDVAEVKRIISAFDKPAPQARLTLWTLQLNSDSGQKTNKAAAERLNQSMGIVDQELSDTRALENTTLARLRGVINEAVAGLASVSQNTHECDSLDPAHSLADCAKLQRILRFYDPSVLKQLNFDLGSTDSSRHDALAKLRKLIPDPADTTTLGEALLVLSLARPVTKNCVRTKFESESRSRLAKLPLTSNQHWRATQGERLPLTWQALGIWEGPDYSCKFDAGELIDTPAGALTSSQLEIVRALRASYDSSVLHRVLDQIEGWLAQASQLDNVEKSLLDLVNRGKALLPPTDTDRLSTLQFGPVQFLSHADAMDRARLTRKAINSLPAGDQISYDELDRQRLNLESLQANNATTNKEYSSVADTLRSYGLDINEADLAQNSRNSLARLKLLVLNDTGLNTASPRVAAADEMLKELIIAVEDDLDREFVQPMIAELRRRLTATGVGVGIVQRESMLATNRGVARIDPRASAQLAVGDQEDILTGIRQLAELYGAAQSGGAAAALGALQQQPREPQPEIYALSTGSKFQVTPVFDPSGQALRFKFDFVATSNVQDPNGTTDTQMPRIERHSINAEVQLSNLETREISRFEVNARLGLPTTYWGGIPLLKDIPHVRPWIPLLGWFVRKGGSNASAQQSVIFGQTTIYPTIGALIDLVSEPGNLPVSQQPPPAKN
ncbi:MAG TPA: hypothetical protein VNX26_12720 [Candidatus Acidoferrum sp.]|nr:hypothetical protein [Candidatus Acidoferrum sp.]